MDLSTLSIASDTFKFDILNPFTGDVLTDDEGKPMWVEVYGEYSSVMKKSLREYQDAQLKLSQKNRNKPLTADQLTLISNKRLAKSIKDWYIIYNGEVPDITEEIVLEMFESLPWFRELVDEKVFDEANFMET